MKISDKYKTTMKKLKRVEEVKMKADDWLLAKILKN